VSDEPVVVLAVTKMLSGMCTGGISMVSGRWVRPVKEFGTVLLGDLTYPDKSVIRPFDIVKFGLIRPRPTPPHIEDWLCNLTRVKPQLTGRLDERISFLDKHSEPEAAQQILNAQRSLALIEPSSVEALFVMDNYSGKYDARVRVPELGERPMPVTDIKWRALGRKLLGGQSRLVLTPDDLREKLSLARIFIALGLSRLHEGRHWPLVVGIHTWPDYEAEIDYRNL